MISLRRAVRKGAAISETQRALMWSDVYGPGTARDSPVATQEALKISAFYRAIDIRSDSMGKLPVTVKDLKTKKEVENHYLGRVLWERPNEAMVPFVYKKYVEQLRLMKGRCFVWVYRSDTTGHPVELIPLPPGTCSPKIEAGTGKLWYLALDPKTGEPYRLDPADILHYKGFTTNGIDSLPLTQYMASVLNVATSRDIYEQAVYTNGGQPSGVLTTQEDLSSKRDLVMRDGTKVSYRDIIRNEWETVHRGPGNAFRTAVLDNGLTYQAISMSNADAQFIESKDVTVADIARFTGVPLNLLFSGKESYASNEQNSLDYVKYSLQPAVTQYEEEDSGKLLTISERKRGLWLPRNMMAELRGDSSSRANWYRAMAELGVYSVNDIRAKEDEPPVPGGDTRRASLNYVPLEDWAELSRSRNLPAETEPEE